jgi:hypothetical protein
MVQEYRHGRCPFVDFIIVLYMVWECRHGRSPFVDFVIVLFTDNDNDDIPTPYIIQ